MFDPAGCLAEFPAQEFDEIAEQVFGRPPEAKTRSGSEAYWRVLGLMEASGKLTPSRQINDYDDGRRLAMEEPTGGSSRSMSCDVIRFIVENKKAAVLQPTI